MEVKELVVHTNSGDVSLGGDFEKLDFSSNSGDLLCRDVTVKQLISQTTSGDIQASGSFARIQATSTSGDISLRTSQMITEAAIQSTSGDVVLFIPENDGFTAQLNSSTGDFICAFPDFHGGDTYRYKDGSAKIPVEHHKRRCLLTLCLTKNHFSEPALSFKWFDTLRRGLSQFVRIRNHNLSKSWHA